VNTPDINSALTLAKLALDFGKVDRATFHRDGRTPESDTDHTVMLQIMALAFRPPQYSTELILKFCLVHDLVEVVVGDTNTAFISEKEMEAKHKREADGRAMLFDLLVGTPNGSGLTSMIELYEEQELREARYVRYLDKLLPKLTHILNGCEAIHQMGRTAEELGERHRDQLEALQKQYPEFVGTELEALMISAMLRSENALHNRRFDRAVGAWKVCGRYGGAIPGPGPCPVCDDAPFGR
jgi:putative hydrolase of HD superfamily